MPRGFCPKLHPATLVEDLGITLEAVKKHLVRAMIELSRSL
jgi:hypothetical protein